VPAALRTLDPAATEGPLDLDNATYFLSKIELRRGPAATMANRRKRLFIATSYITADAAAPRSDHHHGQPHRRVGTRGMRPRHRRARHPRKPADGPENVV
jgi:hypothetical protein